MLTAPKALDPAEPRDAQFVTASLVSSGTTRGEASFVPRNASIALGLAGQVTAIGCLGSKSPWTRRRRTARGHYEALAYDYRQRAEKASRVDAAKAFARSAANAEGECHIIAEAFSNGGLIL